MSTIFFAKASCARTHLRFRLETQDIIADSGEYRYGGASVTKSDLTGKSCCSVPELLV